VNNTALGAGCLSDAECGTTNVCQGGVCSPMFNGTVGSPCKALQECSGCSGCNFANAQSGTCSSQLTSAYIFGDYCNASTTCPTQGVSECACDTSTNYDKCLISAPIFSLGSCNAQYTNLFNCWNTNQCPPTTYYNSLSPLIFSGVTIFPPHPKSCLNKCLAQYNCVSQCITNYIAQYSPTFYAANCATKGQFSCSSSFGSCTVSTLPTTTTVITSSSTGPTTTTTTTTTTTATTTATTTTTTKSSSGGTTSSSGSTSSGSTSSGSTSSVSSTSARSSTTGDAQSILIGMLLLVIVFLI